ncbi:MAG TPA: succinate dehydrogenase cytochrome b subunit [Longimicrobiales bacterium]|nr:succinate dehydrogenase cytochrome b subunit [Longimicrobiales bacterium]
MRRVVNLYRSSVGKKILMALSGLILFGFIVGHMTGNLKVLQGCEPAQPGDVAAGLSVPGQTCAMDTYAEFLRDVGYPLLPHGALLWGFRILLLGAVAVHIFAAFQLWRKSRAARREAYGTMTDISFTYASRTMRWGGIIILLYVVYHLLHFTGGQAHTDFIKGGVHHNYVVAFQSLLVLALYFIANAALCLHLFHGLWSATQTLGANHPKYNHLRRPIATAVSLAIFIGFMTPPVLVYAGVVN